MTLIGPNSVSRIYLGEKLICSLDNVLLSAAKIGGVDYSGPTVAYFSVSVELNSTISFFSNMGINYEGYMTSGGRVE